jgi:DNA (cytosine-5)-methyltransferase 1
MPWLLWETLMLDDRPIALDLGCGVGGATEGYRRAGFRVVGVDIEPQPHYGGDAFIQADALALMDRLLAGGTWGWQLAGLDHFAFIHASMPCQRFSPISRYQRVAENYPDLIEPMRQRLMASGLPWVMENVPQAPLRADIMLCGQMFGLPILRHRAFELGGWEHPEHPEHPEHAPGQSWSGYNRLPGTLTIVGHTYALREGRIAMDMNWPTSREELNEAIPPAYTRWIGTRLRVALGDGTP